MQTEKVLKTKKDQEKGREEKTERESVGQLVIRL